MAKRRPRRVEDPLIAQPDGTLTREGAVPIRVTARVVRADGAAPVRDHVHFTVRQRGLLHVWEPRPDARGTYDFEPGLLRPGVTWFTVFRVCFAPVTVRARVEPNGHVRLGTIRLVLDRALPGTIGVLLSAHGYPHQYPVEVEEVLLGGPAARAGVRSYDQLLEVDGEPVEAASAERLVRGAPGTTVAVSVRRYLSDGPGLRRFVRPRRLTFTIERAPGRPASRRHPLWRA